MAASRAGQIGDLREGLQVYLRKTPDARPAAARNLR